MKIKYIANPLQKDLVEIYPVEYAASPLSEFAQELGIEKKIHIPVVNGSVVDWDHVPSRDDDIFIIVKVAGGNGILGGAALAAGAVLCATGYGTALGTALVSMGAGALVGSVLRPKTTAVSDLSAASPTYNFTGIQSTAGEGQVLALVYGRHRVGGCVIEANVDNLNGDVGPKQLLTATLALSEGEIGGVVHTDGKPEIYINDQPLAYFGNNVWWDERCGSEDQQPLIITKEKSCNYPVNIRFNNITEYIYQVKSYDTHSFELVTGFSPGVHGVCIVEALVKNGEWQTLANFDFNAPGNFRISCAGKQFKQLRIFCNKNDFVLKAVKEHMNIGSSLSQARHYYSIQGVRLTNAGGYIYRLNNSGVSSVRITISMPSLFSTGKNGNMNPHTLDFKVSRSADGEIWTECTTESFTDMSRSTVNFDMDVELTPDTGFIKVDRLTPDSGDLYTSGDSYLKAVTESENVHIRYKNTALLGIRVEPTDRLSGAMPNISAVIDGIKVADVLAVAQSKDYTRRVSNNPADIIYDLLTNKRYGLGRFTGEEQIDMESLCELALWCNEEVEYSAYDPTTGTDKVVKEKRYELNLVLDTQMSAYEALTLICRSVRTNVYWHGDRIKFIIDRPQPPTQLFGMGNIIKDSYVETYAGLADIPNQLEARFLDETGNFRQQTVSAFDSSRTGEPVNSKTIDLYGVTKYSQIKRELVFALKKARSIRRFISFEAGIAGVIAGVGDVILFSHDTPQYGFSGRVSKVDKDTVYFDRILELTPGVRHKAVFSGEYGLKTHEFVPCRSTDSLVIPGHRIKPYDTYAAGVVNKEAIPLRILSVRHTDKFTALVECEEYNKSIYSPEENITVDTPSYSGLGITGRHIIDGNNITDIPVNTAGAADIPSPAAGIKLLELVEKRNGGGITVSVRVDWEASELEEGSLSRIDYYVVMVCGEDNKWSVAGNTKATTFTLFDVPVGKPIKVAVKPYTMYAVTNNNYEVAYITPKGLVETGNAPKIMYAVQNGRYIILRWQPVTNTIVSHYEIRLGSNWAFARTVGTTSACDFSFLAPDGEFVDILIASVNVNGSRGEAEEIRVNTYNVSRNTVFVHDSKASGWNGIHHCMTPHNGELQLNGSKGNYIAGHIDLGKPVKSTVNIDYDIAGYLKSQVRWADMTHSFTDKHEMSWALRNELEAVSHSHEVSLFNALTPDIDDVLRFSGNTASINGVLPAETKKVEYDYGTFHKGIKRGNSQPKLKYLIKNPSREWSVYFRFSLKSTATGSLAEFSDACVLNLGNGNYCLTHAGESLNLTLEHEIQAHLLFCVGVNANGVYFAAGDIKSGKYASISKKLEFNEFDYIKV